VEGEAGNNDDWAMGVELGDGARKAMNYEEARDAFSKFYWGTPGRPGNVKNEKHIVSPAQIERWAKTV